MRAAFTERLRQATRGMFDINDFHAFYRLIS